MTEQPIRVTVFGACGKMGRELIRALSEDPRFRLVGAVDRPDHQDQGRDAGRLAGLPAAGVLVSSDLETALADSDVVIDFSSHEATSTVAASAAARGCRIVCGTTGMTPRGMDALRRAAETVGVVASPNMSVGMNLLFRLVAEVVRTLGPSYDVEIVEWHHRNKKDAPSGTALRLASVAAEAAGTTLERTGRFSRHGLVGPRPRGEIGVAAVRAGDVVGDHTVLFGGDGERLELVHRVSNRGAFARGALRAAAWLMDKPAGLYDMQDVLGLKEP